MMRITEIFVILSFFLFILITIIQFLNHLKLKNVKNYAEPLGNPITGALYSFTFAMSPFKKESAYRHPISYITGLIFHIAIFSSFINILLFILKYNLSYQATLILKIIIILGIISGVGLVLKRIFLKELRSFSNIEDYFTSFLITLFLSFSLTALYFKSLVPYFFLISGVLFLYIPVSKIRHLLFFFYSRLLLGLNFGTKGVFTKRKI